MAQLIYNTIEHSTTKLAPAVVLKGFNPSLQINMNNLQCAAYLDVNEQLEDLHTMQEILKQQLQSAKGSMKHHYDKHCLNCTFQIREWVMLCTKNPSTGRPSQKLDDKQIRPFQIYPIRLGPPLLPAKQYSFIQYF